MNKNYYRFPSSIPRRASVHGVDGMFAWTIFIFLLIGFALFCWIGSFYIFGHPEKAGNYHLLMRLHKLEDPQRFELTEAPRGEFLKPKQLLERFSTLSQREIRRLNDRLLANFLRNYHQTHDLTPYVTGNYRILAAFPLTKKNFFYPGMCALLQSIDQPEIFLEQIFPAPNTTLISKLDHTSNVKRISDAEASNLQETLENTNIEIIPPFSPTNSYLSRSNPNLTHYPSVFPTSAVERDGISGLEEVLKPGQEVKLQKHLDLSTILHIQKLPDGRLQFTTISLLYGSYGPTNNGPILFSLASPSHLNVEAGLPVLTSNDLTSAEQKYRTYLAEMGFSNQENSQQTAEPNSAFVLQIISGKSTTSIKKTLPKNVLMPEKATRATTPPAAQAIVANSPKIAKALPLNMPEVLPATPAISPPAAPATPVALALPVASSSNTEEATPTLTASNQSVLPAPTLFAPPPGAPTTTTDADTLYNPGKMPRGRFVTPSQFNDLAIQGLAGERLYLRGNFSVTASAQDRSVLRYQSSNTSSLTPDRIAKIRIIVTYPPGIIPPAEGTIVSRTQDHPLMITDVKQGNDGTTNIYVREIIK